MINLFSKFQKNKSKEDSKINTNMMYLLLVRSDPKEANRVTRNYVFDLETKEFSEKRYFDNSLVFPKNVFHSLDEINNVIREMSVKERKEFTKLMSSSLSHKIIEGSIIETATERKISWDAKNVFFVRDKETKRVYLEFRQ